MAISHWRLEYVPTLPTAGEENAGNWCTECRSPAKVNRQQQHQKQGNTKSNINVEMRRVKYPPSGQALGKTKPATKFNDISLL